MKIIRLIFISLILVACSTQNNKENKENTKKDSSEKTATISNFETRIKREIEAKLNIPATEKYALAINKAHLNGDEKEDAIVTINRLEFALNEAAKTNTAKRAELGFMGNYNYFFYYDGALDRVSIPMPIASSAKAPLKVYFENIQSEIYKDAIIEYRIRNSAFRNYYLIENGSLGLVFQWKLFDQIGTDNYEANFISYQPGTITLAKDIIISKGKISNYSKNISNVYTYNPTIEKNGEELYRFFYDNRTGKYMTKKVN